MRINQTRANAAGLDFDYFAFFDSSSSLIPHPFVVLTLISRQTSHGCSGSAYTPEDFLQREFRKLVNF